MLPGQRARIDILNDARKIILERSGESKEQLLTAIGVELGLSHMKAREYYYDVVDYTQKGKIGIIDDEPRAQDDELKKHKIIMAGIAEAARQKKERAVDAGEEAKEELKPGYEWKVVHLGKHTKRYQVRKTEPLPDESKDVVEAGEEVNEPYEPEKRPYRKAGKSRKVIKEKEGKNGVQS